MNDLRARRKSAELIRHFISGQVTNFEFEEKSIESNDPVIRAIEDCLWCLYDDFTEHKLNEEHKLSKELKHHMARWLLFLYTDEEYKWPHFSYPGFRPMEHGFWSKLFNGPKKEQEFMDAGDYNVWPFITKESFEYAKTNTTLLTDT